LMTGVREGNAATVRRALTHRRLSRARLSAALDEALRQSRTEIAAMLEREGAVRPPSLDPAILASYAGTYAAGDGQKVLISLEGNSLLATPDDAPPAWLLPMDETMFAAIDLDDASVSFVVEDGHPVGLSFAQGALRRAFKRVAR